ncbi:MAG: DMT family transporter [Bacteroidia bacterium]|nr:DMT family transporter [Bacteroidia bacterium]
MSRHIWLSHVALLVTAIVYSLNYFVAQDLFEQMGPLGVVALRCVAGTLFFTVYNAWFIREKIQDRRDYLRLALAGVLGVAINQLFFLWGLSKTFAVNAAVLMPITPVFVFLVAWIAGAERLTRLKTVGMLLAFVGAVWLSRGDRIIQVTPETITGDILIVLNALSYGSYLVYVRPLVRKYHAFTILQWVFIAGTLINLPIGLPELLQTDWAAISAVNYGRLVFILLLVTIGAYALNGYALTHLPATVVGVYIYLQPIMAAILSVTWRGSFMSGTRLACILLILTGVFAVTWRGKENPA